MSKSDGLHDNIFEAAWTPERAAAEIPGNGSPEAKERIANILDYFHYSGRTFANGIGKRIKILEVSVNPKAEEPQKLEGRLVCEIDVTEDMLNGGALVHGGCTAYLIDVCSTLPFVAVGLHNGGTTSNVNVSQALNIVYHGPAALGDRLRIVSTTLSVGKRAQTSQCEVWNETHHRLVATGVHVKMSPSAPKL